MRRAPAHDQFQITYRAARPSLVASLCKIEDMKQLSTAIALLIAGSATAQCTFTPTISPDNLILCPGEGAVLTTEIYESYQWYKDGNLIPGATMQTYAVDAFTDGGSSFQVEATLDGCTELSASVLVDGWVFLLPTVMSAGDPPYAITQDGALHCDGDTVLLILMLPYDTGIQWTNNGSPINGATNDTLVVTESGNYSVSGAPSICPNFVQQLGVTITVTFTAPPVPEIVLVDDLLCVTPTPDPGSFQWYLNGAPIIADACFSPAVTGAYTVSADYGSPCGSGTSEPYDFFLGMEIHATGPEFFVRPNPANAECTIAASLPLEGPWRLMDAAGREVRSGQFNGCTNCAMDLTGVEAGNYMLSVAERSLRIAVVR